jgi:hypothetical protein
MRELLPCGTYAAFNRHKSRGETPCDACREAKREYDREYQREYKLGRKPEPARRVPVTAARACIQCGAPLPFRSSPREKWCPEKCFREWYEARTGYVPRYGDRRRTKTPKLAEIA